VLLSVVLVVRRHQAWIRPTLRSVLDQDTSGVEVIVLDDASPDHTPRILAEAAGGDPRVNVHRSDRALGIAGARTRALELATGDHAWLLEPTDLVRPGALAGLVAALAGDPDVLLLGEVVRDLYGGERPPDAAPGDRPVLRDRVVRRRLLAGLTGEVAADAFSEIPLATAALARAGSVARYEPPAYAHRELPSAVRRGWSTGSPFEVFAAYDEAFEQLDRTAAPAGRRRALAGAMLAQQRGLLAEVGPARRAEFFGSMAATVAAHRADLPAPRGRLARAELAAIAGGRYPAYQALVRGRRLRRGSLRRLARTVPRNPAMLRARAVQVLYALHRRRPLLADEAVYCAYWGAAYSCNPRAVYEKAAELAPWVHGTWVVKPGAEDVLPPGVPYVVEGSAEYYRVMARATYFVNNANFGNDIVKRPGQVHVQTHHGTPLKTMGLDLALAKHSSMGMNLRRLMRRVQRWDYSISANEFSTEIWERVYPSGTYESLETGYPRNDVLVTASEQTRDRVRAELDLAPSQTAILYTPTHREYTKEYVAMLDVDALATALGPDHVVLMRTHYFYGDTGGSTAANVRDVASYPSIEDLSIASDMLVTDYSSLMFDYAVLDRPIVVYAPDWDRYRTERGTYFDLMAEPPGAVATTQGELTEVLRSGAATDADSAALRAAFRARFCALEDGRAAERVVRRIWPERG
jgi:CDP-glycerol glycerophosphotransferase